MLVQKELKNAYIWNNPVKRATMRVNGVEKQVRPSGWQPWANTLWYYTFDDQNANQITDFSWNNRNLTWGTMPSYALVDWTNYAGNYRNVSSGYAPNYSNFWALDGDFTMLVWVKPTSSSQSYVNSLYYNMGQYREHQISIIWNYNSGQFEYFDYYDPGWAGVTKRTAIKTWASTNIWYLIGYTRNGTSVITYCDWIAWNTITWNNSTISKWLWLWSSNGWDRFKWQIWDCVIEDKARTAQEVADYYNLTKWNYGL